MPEVNFSINEQTGAMEMQVAGAPGTSCTEVATLVKALLGQPAREDNTREFYARPAVQPQIQRQKKK